MGQKQRTETYFLIQLSTSKTTLKWI